MVVRIQEHQLAHHTHGVNDPVECREAWLKRSTQRWQIQHITPDEADMLGDLVEVVQPSLGGVVKDDFLPLPGKQ